MRKPSCADHGRGQRQFGGLARDHVEVGGFLRILGEHLDEAGIVGTVVVVMRTVHVQRSLGDGATAEVQHISQALADSGIQRFVHEGQALRRSEVHRAHAGHGHTCGNTRSSMFGFRLNENQRLACGIQVTFGHFFRPVFAHLRGRRDGISARTVRGFALHHDHGSIAVDGIARTGVLVLGMAASIGTGQFLLEFAQHG